MSNLKVLDGDGNPKYINESGDGTIGDPHIPQVTVTNPTTNPETGLATSAKQDSAAILTGAVTETAPATDTASSGLNGRLQRIAQNISSFLLAVIAQGTTAATRILMIGGKTNDATAQYRELPEGAGGRSVIVEGYAGGPAQPVSLATAPALVAGEAHVGEVGGKITTVSVEFTRENNATPYTAGDVISSSAGSPVVLEIPNLFRINGGSGYVTMARVITNVKSVTPRIRIHGFNVSTPTVSGDNLPHQEKYADSSKRLGYIDLLAMTTGADATNSDMSRGINNTDRWPVTADGASRSLFVLLETLDAVTLTSGSKLTVTLTLDNN